MCQRNGPVVIGDGTVFRLVSCRSILSDPKIMPMSPVSRRLPLSYDSFLHSICAGPLSCIDFACIENLRPYITTDLHHLLTPLQLHARSSIFSPKLGSIQYFPFGRGGPRLSFPLRLWMDEACGRLVRCHACIPWVMSASPSKCPSAINLASAPFQS